MRGKLPFVLMFKDFLTTFRNSAKKTHSTPWVLPLDPSEGVAPTPHQRAFGPHQKGGWFPCLEPSLKICLAKIHEFHAAKSFEENSLWTVYWLTHHHSHYDVSLCKALYKEGTLKDDMQSTYCRERDWKHYCRLFTQMTRFSEHSESEQLNSTNKDSFWT